VRCGSLAKACCRSRGMGRLIRYALAGRGRFGGVAPSSHSMTALSLAGLLPASRRTAVAVPCPAFAFFSARLATFTAAVAMPAETAPA
jgi:hypothetical protein